METKSTSLIANNVSSWISQLIDKSRRNNLLYFNPEYRERFFDLGDLSDETSRKFFDGRVIGLKTLFQTGKEDQESKRVQAIIRKAQANNEDRSIETLYVAVCFVQWEAEDKGRPYYAPLLLLGTDYEQENGNPKSFQVKWNGDIEINESLLVVLKESYNINIDSLAKRIESFEYDDLSELPGFIDSFIEEVRRHLKVLPEFAINTEVILSNFAFQKISLVKDLKKSTNALSQHIVIAALCGDSDAKSEMSGMGKSFSLNELDTLEAQDDFTFLPADSSQMLAIRNVINGKSGIVHGPPGTGKSQTIANLIAELVSRGKKVLFVAEKRAALDVVKNRLDSSNLGDFLIDLHGTEHNRKEFAERLVKALRQTKIAKPDDQFLFDNWNQSKEDLLKHRGLFWSPIGKSEINLHQLYSKLIEEGVSQISQVPELNLALADSLSYPKLLQFCQRLDSYYEIKNDILQTCSDWLKKKNNEAISKELLTEIQTSALSVKNLNDLYNKLKIAIGIGWPITDSEIEYQKQALEAMLSLRKNFEDSILTVSAQQMINKYPFMGTASLQHFYRLWFDRGYKATYKAIRQSFRASGKPNNEEIMEALQSLKIINDYAPNGHWAKVSTGLIHEIIKNLSIITLHLPQIRRIFDTTGHTTLLSITSFISNLNKQLDYAEVIDLYYQERRIWEDASLLKYLDSDINNRLSLSAFYLLSVYHFWEKKNPRLRSYTGTTIQKRKDFFVEQDIALQKHAPLKVKYAVAQEVVTVLDNYPNQESYIRNQSARKRPHPIKKVIQEAPNAFMAVFPCWLASPLSITKYLPEAKQYFDVVLFDEASQIMPADAISSILRGKQLVAAGDHLQLPPTSFFADSLDTNDDNNEESASTAGMESLLDLVRGNLPLQSPSGWFLSWHYRSKFEELIAFSNRHIYGNQLVTFPNSKREVSVEWHQVHRNENNDFSEESSSAEVLAVVDKAIEIYRGDPLKSIGIIGFGIKHAMRIQAELDKQIERDQSLSLFFQKKGTEGNFVKNLERVQGDERDVILLSIGYGQGRNGTMHYNFGPINQEGGERRLNVAITRAKEKMIVFSCFDPSMLDQNRLKNKGAKLLGEYLLFAKSEGSQLDRGEVSEISENPFERDIRESLEREGLEIISQLGVSGFRLDMAVIHPERKSEFIMAIECDGATYHSAPSARDRDRLRQEHLERLGWKFHRIWSTDWFRDKQGEVKRTLARYKQLLSENEPTTIQFSTRKTSSNSPINETRGKRPFISPYENIKDIPRNQLIDLLEWINSDGIPRTRFEMEEELFQQLNFSKRGARIKTVINSIIDRYEDKWK